MPDLLMPTLIDRIHKKLLHVSASGIKLEFKRSFYHRFLTQIVKKYVDSCVTCKYLKPFVNYKQEKGIIQTFQADQPGEVYFLDLVPMPTSKGYNYLLVAIDQYSSFITAVKMKNKSKDSVLQALDYLLDFRGLPKAFYSDNEITFISALREI